MQDRFKQLLKEKNLTAAQFATMIKINPSAMSHILNGRSKPGFDLLDKIGQTFPDINLNWLISGKDAPYTNSVIYKKNEDYTIQNTESTFVHKEKEISLQTTEEETKTLPEIPMHSLSKEIKRIVLFFNDGSFEVYEK